MSDDIRKIKWADIEKDPSIIDGLEFVSQASDMKVSYYRPRNDGEKPKPTETKTDKRKGK